jgi:predicted protein tyrosine phosphatase
MMEQRIRDIVLVGHRVYAFEDVTADAVAQADAIVSIGDPGESMPLAVSRSRKRRLRLTFFDFDHEHGESPQIDHVRDLIAFAKDLQPGQKLLVHCYAGISRSTASLAIILAVLHPELDYDAIFEAVHRIRPEAWPNKRIIAYADHILKCEGQFNDALQRFRWRVTESEDES